MTHLIPQSKIDEAANSLGSNEVPFIKDHYDHGLKVGIEFGFEKGAQFVLNETQSLIIEFAEWLDNNMWTRHESENKIHKNVGIWYNTPSFRSMEDPQTIQKLLEQFIKERTLNEELCKNN